MQSFTREIWFVALYAAHNGATVQSHFTRSQSRCNAIKNEIFCACCRFFFFPSFLSFTFCVGFGKMRSHSGYESMAKPSKIRSKGQLVTAFSLQQIFFSRKCVDDVRPFELTISISARMVCTNLHSVWLHARDAWLLLCHYNENQFVKCHFWLHRQRQQYHSSAVVSATVQQ